MAKDLLLQLMEHVSMLSMEERGVHMMLAGFALNQGGRLVNDHARLARLACVPVSQWPELWATLCTVGWSVVGDSIVQEDVLRKCEHDARIRKVRRKAGKIAGLGHTERASRTKPEPSGEPNENHVVPTNGIKPEPNGEPNRNQMVPTNGIKPEPNGESNGNHVIPSATKSATYSTQTPRVRARASDPDLRLQSESQTQKDEDEEQTPEPATLRVVPNSEKTEADDVGDLESEILRTVSEFQRCYTESPTASQIVAFRKGLARVPGGTKPHEIRRRVDRFFSEDCATQHDTRWIFYEKDKVTQRQPTIQFLVQQSVWEQLGKKPTKLRAIPKPKAAPVGGTFHSATEKAADRKTGDLTDSLKDLLKG